MRQHFGSARRAFQALKPASVLPLALLLLLILPLSYAENYDPCPGCKNTLISARFLRGEDASGAATATFAAQLVASNPEYNFDDTSISQALRDAVRAGTGTGDLDPLIFKESALDELRYKHAIEFMQDRVLKVYKDEDGNAEAGPADTLMCSMTTDADGRATCTVPLTSLPTLRCDNYLIVFNPADTPAAPASPAPPGTTPPAADIRNYKPSMATVEACGNFILPLGSLQSQFATTCLPVFLLFGLLAAAMYASGKNPTALLDISTPRLPKPKPYGMRRISIGTGGPMQRVFLNKQVWLSQKLFDRTAKTLIRDMKASGKVNSADIDFFVNKYGKPKSWDQRKYDHLAAALRMLSAGRSREQVEAEFDRLKERAKNKAKGDELQQMFLLNNELRRIIHIGDTSEIFDTAGKKVAGGRALMIGQRKQLRYQAYFRSLHDAVWHEENAKRAIAASGAAGGLAGTKIEGPLKYVDPFYWAQTYGVYLDNRNKKNGEKTTDFAYHLNLLPRIADRGFVGAFVAQRIGALRMVNNIWWKNVSQGLPVLFGFRKATAKAGKAADPRPDLMEKAKAMNDSFSRRMVRAYRLIELATVEIDPVTGQKKLTADSIRKIREFLLFGNGSVDKYDEHIVDNVLQKLLQLKASGGGIGWKDLKEMDKAFLTMENAFRAKYDGLQLVDKDYASQEKELNKARAAYEAAKLKKNITEQAQWKAEIGRIEKGMAGLLGDLSKRTDEMQRELENIDSKSLNGLLLRQMTNREMSEFIWEGVSKTRIFELAKFAEEHGIIDGAVFRQLVIDVNEATNEHAEGDLASKYGKMVNARSAAHEATERQVFEAELIKNLLLPIKKALDRGDFSETDRANLYKRLGNIFGIDCDVMNPRNPGAREGDIARILWMLDPYVDAETGELHNMRLNYIRRAHGADIEDIEKPIRRLKNEIDEIVGRLNHENLTQTEREALETRMQRLKDAKKPAEESAREYYRNLAASLGITFDRDVSLFEQGNISRKLFNINMSELLSGQARPGYDGLGGSKGYIEALGNIYSTDPAKLKEIINRQLEERWSTPELGRLIINNKDSESLMNILGVAALRLGLVHGTGGNESGPIPRRGGESDAEYNDRVRQHYAETQRVARELNERMNRGQLTKKEDDEIRTRAISFLLNRRAMGGIDETRQVLVEMMSRESFAQGIAGLKPYVDYVGGSMVDLADINRRLNSDAKVAQALSNKGIISGGDVTVGMLGKGVWMTSPDKGFIPVDEKALSKDDRSSFELGGMEKVIHGRLVTDAHGDKQIQESTGFKRWFGNKMDAYIFTVFEDYMGNAAEAKAILKYNKQAARTMEHGPVATLGLSAGKGATGAFAGEYSELTERKMHLVDYITKKTLEMEAYRIAQKKQTEYSPEAAAKIGEEVAMRKREIDAAYVQMHQIERDMTSKNEERYHDAFFRFARHFREIDDTLTVGKTERALSSTWGSTLFTDMLYNFGLATPWQPWHGIRGRMPFGTPLAIGLQPGWMVGKYFAERMRPYALMASGMPPMNQPQDPGQSDWNKAVLSLLPISPESFKFWHLSIPVFRKPERYGAVETDADMWGSYGYEVMEALRAQKRLLEQTAQSAAVDEKKRIEAEIKKQEQVIREEFLMVQKGYYREIDEQATVGTGATQMKDEYRSLYLKDKKTEDRIEVDNRGNIVGGVVGRDFAVDSANMRILPPVYHTSAVGTAPVERLEDYFLDLGVIAAKVPWLSRLARIPIAPAYYDFDAYEPDPDRHGRMGMIGTQYAYHAPVGTVFGVAGLVSALPWVGQPLARGLAHLPFLAPLGTEPGIWGAKTLYSGKYVNEGLTGAAHMWMKWLPTYEQMPLYRMGESMPVAGVTYFSPYKYMDPNLVQTLVGKYQYLVEPHENLTAYPSLSDEFTREMSITELMQKRQNELSMFQHMGLAQLGGMIPAFGVQQSLFIGLSLAGMQHQKVADARDRWLLQERLYRYLANDPRLTPEEQRLRMANPTLYHSCPRCMLQGRGGQQCLNCGSYVPLA